MTSSAVNNCHYGNVIMPLWSTLDREIQRLSCVVWCAVKIMVCKFLCGV